MTQERRQKIVNGDIDRRDFLKASGSIIGSIALSSLAGKMATGGELGEKVETRKLMTCTATFDPSRPQIAREVSRLCQEDIGFDLKALPIKYNQNAQRVIMEQNYDVWLVRMTGSPIRIDPNVYTYKMHHSSQYGPGMYGWTGYSNSEVDELLEKQQASVDREKRQELIYEVQKLIHEDQPENVLVNPDLTGAYRTDRIKNIVPMMGSGIGSFWTDINMEVVEGDGYVRTGVTQGIQYLNPLHVVDSIDFQTVRMFYDRLLRISPEGTPQPWAAKSYQYTDPKTIKVTLREGMKFHDGHEVTAEDVKFTFDYHKEWKAPFFLESLKKLEEVEQTGKYSVTFHLTEPYAPFLSNVLGMIFLIPKHVWKDIPGEVDVEDALNYPNKEPIGSGPFRFDYRRRGSELRVSAFEDHFHPPNCAGIIQIVYGSHDAMAAAIEKGECDRNRYILKPSLSDDLDKLPNVKGVSYKSHGWYNLSWHNRISPFKDRAFRRALAHVIPKNIVKDIILEGHATKGGSVIGPANKSWHNPEVKPFEKNVEMARQILKDAGYGWDKNGWLHYPPK